MRIGVLGLGFMGSTHLKALASIPGVEVGAVFSADPKKLEGDLSTVQGNLGGPGQRLDFSQVAKYGEIEPLLQDASLEAVDICLPTRLHAPVAIAALQAGKHVLVEKPIALDAPSAYRMVEEASRCGRLLMTAQVLRFHPAYVALRETLRSGELGPTRWATFRRRCAAPAWGGWLLDPIESGGGVFDLLIHDLDMCLHLFGKPASVSASGYEALASGVDLIAAELHYPTQGLTAIIAGGWHHPKSFPFSMEYTVVADGGTLEYDSAGPPPAIFRANGESTPMPIGDRDGYEAEIAYFIDCVRAGREPVICPARESADAVALAQLVLQARNRSGEKIECNL